MSSTVREAIVKITVDVPAEKREQFHLLWEQILSDEDAPINQHVLGVQNVRKEVQAQGVAALHRLYRVAQGDTGQSGVVARFLAGLYNGQRIPFDLTDFRRLDNALYEDCMALLRMDARHCVQEVHNYVENGGAKWEQMISDWDMEKKSTD